MLRVALLTVSVQKLTGERTNQGVTHSNTTETQDDRFINPPRLDQAEIDRRTARRELRAQRRASCKKAIEETTSDVVYFLSSLLILAVVASLSFSF